MQLFLATVVLLLFAEYVLEHFMVEALVRIHGGRFILGYLDNVEWDVP